MTHNEKSRGFKQKPLILFSPLDWGLGHTTRSIPLLRAFQERGWRIVVACNSTQKILLQQEIYGLDFRELAGYNVSYGFSEILTRFKLAGQLGKILMKIKHESEWIRAFVGENKVDLILSDNRYGFRHPSVPSILITHQLRPRTGLPTMIDVLVQRFLYTHINRYAEVWIPDVPEEPGFSGILSHVVRLPHVPVRFVGPLSRFEPDRMQTENGKIVFLLSGPEPQRSIFEGLLMDEVRKSKRAGNKLAGWKYVLVRGLPGASKPLETTAEISIFDHLSSAELENLLTQARYVVCRSGYTSLMDLMKLRKKMILVPTPGQSEQEYLASHFEAMKYAPSFSQRHFSLQRAVETAEAFPYAFPCAEADLYTRVVDELSARIIASRRAEAN